LAEGHKQPEAGAAAEARKPPVEVRRNHTHKDQPTTRDGAPTTRGRAIPAAKAGQLLPVLLRPIQQSLRLPPE